MLKVKGIFILLFGIILAVLLGNISHLVPICETCVQKIMVKGIPFPDSKIISLVGVEDSGYENFIFWLVLLAFIYRISPKKPKPDISLSDILGWIIFPAYFLIGFYEIINPYFLNKIYIDSYKKPVAIILLISLAIVTLIVRKISKKKIIYAGKEYYDNLFISSFLIVIILVILGVF